MAKIGLKFFRYSILTVNGDGTYHYNGAKTPGKAINCSVSVNNNTAKLRADDEDAEIATGFSGGTVSMGIDRADPETHADILGHEITRDGNMIRNANDIAPYVGLGRVITLLEDGVQKFKTEIINKVKFSEPNQEDNTKQETISFGTYTMEGQIGTLPDGAWSDSKVHSSFSTATEYIETVFAAPAAEGTTPDGGETT